MHITPVERATFTNPAEFLRRYKTPSRPVVMGNLSQDWPARRDWTVDHLCARLGERDVPLYGGEARGRQHQHAAVQHTRFRDFVEQLRQGHTQQRLFFYNILEQAPELLKDFAFPNTGLRLFKRLPVLFMGGQGAKVQMHFDIDWADLLLFHFGGKKRVYLFAPDQTPCLYHVPFSFSSVFEVDVEHPDFKRFPALAHAQGQVAELAHGDCLYIPPGYWHYVVYDELCFSMTLRALPRTPRHLLSLLTNVLWVRTADGLMRKLLGQRWNERNRALAFDRGQRLAMEMEAKKGAQTA